MTPIFMGWNKMTLDEVKAMLLSNDISFNIAEFENEADYWHHTMLFPYTKNAKPCKVIALIVTAPNGKKNIELQFNSVDGVFSFEELCFGDYCFELFDMKEEYIAEAILTHIGEIRGGNLYVISANDIHKKQWLGDACFDLDSEDAFGSAGFQKAMQKINGPKGFWSKLRRTNIQYEVFSWNTYQCIVK